MNEQDAPIVDRRDWPPRNHDDDVREELDRQVGTTGISGRYDLDPEPLQDMDAPAAATREAGAADAETAGTDGAA